MKPSVKRLTLLGLLAATVALPETTFAQALSAFTAGDIVVSVEGDGAGTGSYADNAAAPLTLYEYSDFGTSFASYVGSFVLPQTSSGGNSVISGEYGSSSEGTLQLSGNGQYLTIMGYGISAAAFNANPGAYSPVSTNTALAQSGSLTNQSTYTPVARVVALIGANGSVDTSTALYNVFDANNPRSAYTVDGTSFYVSGQGSKGDATGGVFYAAHGASSATAITGADSTSKTVSQDTRQVQVYNGQLYVSADSTSGSGSNRDFIGTLGSAGSLPTSLANSGNGPTQLTGFGTGKSGMEPITAATSNGVNAGGQTINLSPENYFFANATTLYVADSGSPKNTSASSSLGDGGLQKWSLVNGIWTLDYTLSQGLNLVANTATSGSTGLFGLTGQVVGGLVELYATNYTIGDLDPTYLYGITDTLSATTQTGETFTELAAAPADSNFKGVSFAPSVSSAPEPSAWVLMFAGVGLVGGMLRHGRRRITLATA